MYFALARYIFLIIFAPANLTPPKSTPAIMKRTFKVNFNLRSMTDPESDTIIYVGFTVDKRYKISTNRQVKPKWWNPKTQRAVIIESGEQTQTVQREYKRLNKFLDELAEKILREYVNNWCRPEVLEHARKVHFGTIDPVKHSVDLFVKKKDKAEEEEAIFKNQTPSQYFQSYIDELATHVVERTGKIMKSSSATNHKIVLKRYKEFIAYKHWADSFEVIENSKRFGKEMEGWLLGVKNYTPNTVCATFSVMKVWLNKAKEDGLFNDNAFHKWKSKGYEVDRVYLTEEELDKIYKLTFDNDFKEENHIDNKSCIEQTRDLFIIGAWTGLRISDLENLNVAIWSIEERKLRIYNNKTDKYVVIPLANEVIELYKKYEGKFPRPVYKSAFNRHIQRCAEIAGITECVPVRSERGGKTVQVQVEKYKLISSHAMRRSFATNFYRKCRNAQMVMKITGHTTEQNFKRYLRWNEEENADMAMKYFIKDAAETKR